MDPFIIKQCPSLSFFMVFVLKFILSDMSIATPAFLSCPLAWNISFHALTFNLYVSSALRWVSYRQHIVGFFFFLFCSLGPHLWHVEVPMLGLNWNWSCWPMPQPQKCRIWAMSATYSTTHGKARSLTHCVRPGIEPMSSWILVGFIITEPQGELQLLLFFFLNPFCHCIFWLEN